MRKCGLLHFGCSSLRNSARYALDQCRPLIEYHNRWIEWYHLRAPVATGSAKNHVVTLSSWYQTFVCLKTVCPTAYISYCLSVCSASCSCVLILSLSLSLGWAYLSHSAEATYWAHGATLSVCVCAWCVVESFVLYLVNAPSLILASFLCTKSCGCPCPGRPGCAGTPIKRAGSRPATQRTAHSPHGLGHQYQLSVQTAIKRLSKFNCCHLSHIKEDTGQPSVPVQEFNPIACSPSLPGPGIEPTAGRCALRLVV